MGRAASEAAIAAATWSLRRARDAGTAARLWQEAERLAGVALPASAVGVRNPKPRAGG
jgi:hypothetical protein